MVGPDSWQLIIQDVFNFFFLFYDQRKWYCGEINVVIFGFLKKMSSGPLMALPMKQIPIRGSKKNKV